MSSVPSASRLVEEVVHSAPCSSTGSSGNLTIPDIVLDSSILANELEQSVQQLHHQRYYLIHLTRFSFLASAVATAVASRLYYILYHAPLRHAWRLREAKRRVPQYQRAMKGFSITGISGFLFLLSPIGFPHQAEYRSLQADALDGLAMRSLVVREEGKKLCRIAEINHYHSEIVGNKKDIAKECHTCDTPIAALVHIRIPCWDMEYCDEQYSLATKAKEQQQTKRLWSAFTSHWSLWSPSPSSSSTTLTLPRMQLFRSLLLHPEQEMVKKEWKWILKGGEKEEMHIRNKKIPRVKNKGRRLLAHYVLLRTPREEKLHHLQEYGEMNDISQSVLHAVEKEVKEEEKARDLSIPGCALKPYPHSSTPFLSLATSRDSVDSHLSRFNEVPFLDNASSESVETSYLRRGLKRTPSSSFAFLSRTNAMKMEKEEEEEWKSSTAALQSLWCEGVLQPLNIIRSR